MLNVESCWRDVIKQGPVLLNDMAPVNDMKQFTTVPTCLGHQLLDNVEPCTKNSIERNRGRLSEFRLAEGKKRKKVVS